MDRRSRGHSRESGNLEDKPRGNDAHSAKRLPARLRNALFAEWSKFSPTLEWDCTEREARIRFANETLFPQLSARLAPITSWSDLTSGQAKRLLHEMKERSGSNAAYRAQLIARLAVELWGGASGSTGGWDAFLRERLRERFRLSTLDSLTPAQAHELIEELLSRIARAQLVGERSALPQEGETISKSYTTTQIPEASMLPREGEALPYTGKELAARIEDLRKRLATESRRHKDKVNG